jgi:hypothetical protein
VGGSIPDRYVRSIVEQAYRPPMVGHVEEVSLLTPANVAHYDFDPTFPPEYRRSKAFDDRHVYRLRNICVSTRTGVCWVPGGPVLEESLGPLIRLLGWGRAALDEPLVGASQTLEGPVVVLPNGGYFHWLLEALPAALHALEHEPDATLLIPRAAPRFLGDAVELLGVGSRVHRSDDPVQVEYLVLAARDPFSGFVPSEDVEILRRTFLPRVGRGADDALYISRRLDARRPANDDEVARALERLGVSALTAQSLPLAEQIELFAGARVVVGPHGAGLANLVWSADLQAVAEIFLVGHFNDCYARLAVSRGASYTPFHCSPLPGSWGSAPVDELAGWVPARGAPVEFAGDRKA